MNWRPERDWDKETLDNYLIMSGWRPANMQGALNLVAYVADAMLGALKAGYTFGDIYDKDWYIYRKGGTWVFIPEE